MELAPGGKSLAYDHPLYIEDALVDFPGLRPILAHCGFAWSELVLMLMARDSRVAADFAWWSPSQPPWRAAQTLSMAKYLGVLDRLFWGTDYPFTELRRRRGSTGARCPTSAAGSAWSPR